jgi:hypothetical protein
MLFSAQERNLRAQIPLARKSLKEPATRALTRGFRSREPVKRGRADQLVTISYKDFWGRRATNTTCSSP